MARHLQPGMYSTFLMEVVLGHKTCGEVILPFAIKKESKLSGGPFAFKVNENVTFEPCEGSILDSFQALIKVLKKVLSQIFVPTAYIANLDYPNLVEHAQLLES